MRVLIGAGVLIGTVASVALQRLMGTLIYRASILDGATAVAIACLTLAGLLACYLPALRAARRRSAGRAAGGLSAGARTQRKFSISISSDWFPGTSPKRIHFSSGESASPK